MTSGNLLVRTQNSIRSLFTRFPLIAFILWRIVAMIITLFVLGFLVFALMSLAPGDIVDRLVLSYLLSSQDYQTDEALSGEAMDAARARLGLDKPFYIQYLLWLKRAVVERDLGRSLITRAPILFLIRERMVNSLILNLISLVFLTVSSFAIGVYLSSKAGTRLDVGVGFLALFFHAFPGILMLILLQLVAATSGWFPVTAYPSFPRSEAPVRFVFSYMHHILLPLLGAFISGIGSSLRVIRATMLDQLGKPYIVSLRSRGIAESRIRWAHAFRNAMNPFITGSANLLAGLFSGSLILEIIFAYPGIGRLTYQAVTTEDVNLVLASIMFVSFLVLIGIIISDICLALVDPRIRFGSKNETL